MNYAPVNLIKIIVLSCVLMASQVCAVDTLTEAKVSDFSASVLKAVKAKEVEQFQTFFKADAKIHLNMPKVLGGRMDLPVEEYIAMIKLGWAMPAEYDYEVQNIEIILGADGQTAEVKETVLEKMSMNDRLFSSTSSDQVTSVKLISGELKVMALKIDITLLDVNTDK